MKTASSLTNSAKVISNKNYKSILELSIQEHLNLFKQFGVLLFRDFGVNYKQMTMFAEQFSSKFVLDKDRPIVNSGNKFVTLVDPGMHYVSPHCENANSPLPRCNMVLLRCASSPR